jgi:hypothetical protein
MLDYWLNDRPYHFLSDFPFILFWLEQINLQKSVNFPFDLSRFLLSFGALVTPRVFLLELLLVFSDPSASSISDTYIAPNTF